MPDPELRILLRVSSVNTLQPSAKEDWDLPDGALQRNGRFDSHAKLNLAPQFLCWRAGNPLHLVELILRQEFANEIFVPFDAFERMELKNKIQLTLVGQSSQMGQ